MLRTKALTFNCLTTFHSISCIVLEYRPVGLYLIFSIQLQSDSQLRWSFLQKEETLPADGGWWWSSLKGNAIQYWLIAGILLLSIQHFCLTQEEKCLERKLFSALTTQSELCQLKETFFLNKAGKVFLKFQHYSI